MRHALQLILFLLFPVFVFAGNTTVSTRLSGNYSSSTNPLGIGNQRTIFLQDDEFYYMSTHPTTWSTVFHNQRVVNRVQLHYQESARVYYSSSWSVAVPLQIKTYDWNGTLLATETCTLTVAYDPANGVAYKDIDTYTATTPGYRTEVKINGAPTCTGAIGSTIPSDVLLESSIETERYYVFNETAVPTVDYSLNTTDRQITFYWDWMAGAEEYDLEYLFVSSTDAVALANPDFSKAVRVTTSLQSYTINNMFEGGELLYRVRGVGRHGTNYAFSLPGAWGNGSSAITVTNPHIDINWTYMSMFAEDGKRSELLTLYDKSLRPRQQVTLQNSTNVAMIAETYYDYEGRAVINTMPSPSLDFDNVMDFYSAQTFKDQGTPAQLHKKDYDNDQNYSSSVCGSSSSPGLSPTKGASRYYSPSNSLNALTYNTAIPDAEKFPYTQVKYDDQGRVVEEGSPGKSHHIGTDHTTQYFYASASQDRLDRLFGNEVGYSQHYKERASMDANGQMSLAYLDLSGKVIATSLVGAKPANLDAVSTAAVTPTAYTEHFESQNHYDPARQAWVVSTDFLVTNPGSNYVFTYELTPEQYQALCSGTPGDHECKYDLTMTIYDGCRNPQHENTYDPPTTTDNVLNTTLQLNPYNLSATFTVVFPHAGTYHIEKVLTLDQEMFDAAVATFAANVDQCIHTVDEISNNFSVSGDCNDCATFCAQQADAQSLTGTERDAFIATCEAENCQLQAEPGACDGLLFLLEKDMSPGGQYYDASGWLTTYLWANSGSEWTDADFRDPSNTLITTWAGLTSNWQSGWATKPFATAISGKNSLVEFHPEYCHYQWCVDNEDSRSYNVRMYSSDSISWAKTHETYLTSGNNFIDVSLTDTASNVFNDDPFFTGVGSSAATAMSSEMSNYHSGAYTMWTVAGDSAGCHNCDAQWVQFRALYLSTKSVFERQVRDSSGCTPLVDDDFPPDLIADGTSFVIRAPDYSNQMEDITTVSDAEDFGDSIAVHYDMCKKGAVATFSVTEGNYTIGSATTITITVALSPTVEITNSVVIPVGAYTSAQIVMLIVNAINNYTSSPDYSASIDPSDPNQFIVYAPAEIGSSGNVSSTISGFSYLTGGTFTGGNDNSPCPTGINCVCAKIQQLQDEYNATIPNTSDYYVDHTTYTTSNSYVLAQLEEIYYPGGGTTLTSTQVNNWITNCAADPGNPENGLGGPEPLPAEMDCDQVVTDCDEDAPEINDFWANFIHDQEAAAAIDSFKVAYVQQCFGGSFAETFKVDYEDYEYQYTLYYYDQAGNLTRTVPPAAVQPLNSTSVAAVQTYRNTGTGSPVYPNHVHSGNNMVTNYKYNSFNEPIESTTPDAGTTTFFYDKIGRIVASQNAKQAAASTGGNHYYSYTLYDGQSRIREVGEIDGGTLSTGTAADYAGFEAWVSLGGKSQVTSTYYDAPLNATIDGEFALGQENLRKRVATVTIEDVYDGDPDTYDHATHYSYDIHGNVKELVQEFPEWEDLAQRYKHIAYNYDLISGNVNQVCYQRGKGDEFYHQYYYDADNRLTNVYTSRDSVIWDQDAKYFYYLHGPKARTETGDLKVQGQDYAYTIMGWLKGVNTNVLDRDYDLGKDGQATNSTNYSSTQAGIHSDIALDVFGFSLGYFWNTTSGEKDYTPINSSATSLYNDVTALNDAGDDLFNGNIKEMATALSYGNPTGLPSNMPLIDNHYHYDQLNRIVSSNSYVNTSYTAYTGLTTTAHQFQNTFTYDANGNIITQVRNGNSTSGTSMDDLHYYYKKAVSGTYDPASATPNDATNRLDYVTDAGTSGNYADDLETESSGNYTYDAIGQLTADASENISAIDWNVYGKIKNVTRNSDSKKDLNFEYDAMGNRIVKIAKPRASGNVKTQDYWDYTYYVRDAQGNVMATYTRTFTDNMAHTQVTDKVTLDETDMYGSERLGIIARGHEGISSDVTYTYSGFDGDNKFDITGGIGTTPLTSLSSTSNFRELGRKAYELVNHLGNVLVTVSDRKLLKQQGMSATIEYYTADVRSTTDYSAFGAPMPGRSMNSGDYRYSINGQEKDDELGNGVTSAEFWEYDGKLGRRWNTDPLEKEWESPYTTFNNNPILFCDPDGDDPDDPTSWRRFRSNLKEFFTGNPNIRVRTKLGGWVKKDFSTQDELHIYTKVMYDTPGCIETYSDPSTSESSKEILQVFTIAARQNAITLRTSNNGDITRLTFYDKDKNKVGQESSVWSTQDERNWEIISLPENTKYVYARSTIGASRQAMLDAANGQGSSASVEMKSGGVSVTDYTVYELEKKAWGIKPLFNGRTRHIHKNDSTGKSTCHLKLPNAQTINETGIYPKDFKSYKQLKRKVHHADKS